MQRNRYASGSAEPPVTDVEPQILPPEPEPAKDLSEIGRKLSGPAGGLDCLSCHGIGPKGATKVFEAPAPNFKVVRARHFGDLHRERIHTSCVDTERRVLPSEHLAAQFQ